MADLFQQFKENLMFALVSILIIVALAVGAKVAEHFLPKTRKTSPARKITIIAICSAIATVLHVMDFPLPFLAPGFYKLDFSELPVLLCGFYLGPAAAVFCEILKILLKLLLNGTSTAFVGDFANFAVGCAMVLPAVIIYHTRKTRASALMGMIAGTLTLTIFGSIFNGVYLLPRFAELYGKSLEDIVAAGTLINSNINSVTTFVIWAVVPLNLIKGVAVSVLTLLLYKRVARPLFGLQR